SSWPAGACIPQPRGTLLVGCCDPATIRAECRARHLRRIGDPATVAPLIGCEQLARALPGEPQRRTRQPSRICVPQPEAGCRGWAHSPIVAVACSDHPMAVGAERSVERNTDVLVKKDTVRGGARGQVPYPDRALPAAR